MIAGLFKICAAAEYLGVSPKRAKVMLANMGVKPVTENPSVWRKLDIDRELGIVGAPVQQTLPLTETPAPEPVKNPNRQICKSVWVPEDQHAAIKAFAEGLGMEVRHLAAKLLCEMVEKKTNGEHKTCSSEITHNGASF